MPAVLAARLVHMSLVFQTRKLQLGWLAMQSEGGAEARENLCAELLYRPSPRYLTLLKLLG